MPHSDRVQLGSAQLRCLAHPLRSRLLASLRLDGPATSAGLADRLGTNTGATSYHLRQLAEVGLVEEQADRGTARERWWAAAHQLSSWVETDFDDDPDDRAAHDWLLGDTLRQRTRAREHWLATRQEWGPDWREAADWSDVQVVVTADRLASMVAELHEVIERYRAEPSGGDDAERVMVLLEAFPFERIDW